LYYYVRFFIMNNNKKIFSTIRPTNIAVNLTCVSVVRSADIWQIHNSRTSANNNNNNNNNCPTDHSERRSVGDLECLHKACQAAITDGGLFTDTGVDERCENERQSENYCEMKTLSRVKGPENRDHWWHKWPDIAGRVMHIPLWTRLCSLPRMVWSVSQSGQHALGAGCSRRLDLLAATVDDIQIVYPRGFLSVRQRSLIRASSQRLGMARAKRRKRTFGHRVTPVALYALLYHAYRPDESETAPLSAVIGELFGRLLSVEQLFHQTRNYRR